MYFPQTKIVKLSVAVEKTRKRKKIFKLIIFAMQVCHGAYYLFPSSIT